jgi:heat shock protein HslJ
MRKFGLVLGCVLFGLYIVSAATASPMQLAGTEWGFPEESGKDARFLQFRPGAKASGFTGCNYFTGTYTQDGSMLRFGPLAATRRACVPSAMKREEQFLQALNLVREAEGTQLKLTLRDAEGNALVVLARRNLDR